MAVKKYTFLFTLADGTTHRIPIEIPVGEPGGYYIPVLRQVSDTEVEVSYTPSNPGMPTVKPVTIKIPGGGSSGGNVDYAGVEPAEDDIPKIFFGGSLQQTKDEAVVPFRYISKTDDFSGYAEIKAQGNSSMNYPKKSQTVKMFADEACESKMKKDFKGWGKQNKHVYKANWIDLSHARNVVSARLWADVVKSRTNYLELPELLRTSPNQGAVDGFPIKVYADGVYQGRYTLNIPKDKWTFNMDDGLDTHCVLCGENYYSGCFRAVAKIDESDWTDEIHDVVPESIKTRWNEVIGFVMNSTDEEFKANLSQYFYVDSLIDYYLFGLASCGLDAFGKNQIYATYDGQKWIASMYDMDSTWGLYWNGSKFVATDYDRTSYEDFVSGESAKNGNLLYIRLEQLFYEELKSRWEELKNGALSIVNIINRFERFTDIAPAELVKEDYASTTGGGKFTGIPSQTTNNIQQIRSFALARQAWADAYVSALTGGGTQPEPEEPEVPDNPVQSSVLYENYSPAGEKFFTTANINWDTQFVEADIDLTNQTADCNIFSVGENIAVWSKSNSFHLSYIPSSNEIDVTAITGSARPFGSCARIALGNTHMVVIRIDKNGVVLNGRRLTESDYTYSNDGLYDGNGAIYAQFAEYIQTLSAVQVGSTEGSNRSYATYNYIKVDTAVPFTSFALDKTELTFDGKGSQILKISATPADANDTVAWSSSDTKVATADIHGTVTAVGNGVATITATCGTHSASCKVTVSGVAYPVIYSLPEETAFDGTSTFVDTGVKIAKEDSDFTIVLHATAGGGNANNDAVLHAMHEASGYPGYCVASNGSVYTISGCGARFDTVIPTNNAEFKMVIMHEAGQKGCSVKYLYNGAVKDGTIGSYNSPTANVSIEENLLLGCYQTTSGAKGRYWNGTIYDFKVYGSIMTNADILAYLT